MYLKLAVLKGMIREKKSMVEQRHNKVAALWYTVLNFIKKQSLCKTFL